MSLEEMARRLQDLEKKNASLESEVTRLRQDEGEAWLSEQRANEIRGIVLDTLADADSRASLQSTNMTAGWDNGFFLQSPDGRFRLEIGGLLQIRYVYSQFRTPSPAVGVAGINPYWSDDRKTRAGFDLPGTQLWFQGHVFGPAITYKIKGEFTNNKAFDLSTSNVRPLESGSGSFRALDVWVRTELSSNLFFRTGQFKLPFSREELVDRQNQLAVEPSVVNGSLGIGYSQGLELTYVDDLWRNSFAYSDGADDQVAGQLKVGGSLPANRPFSWGQVEWALTNRLEFKPYGDWKDFDSFTSPPGSEFGLLFGFGVHWQSWRPEYGYMQTQVNQGDNDLLMFTADASANFGGASLFGSLSWAYADSEGAYYYAGANNFNINQYGNMGSSNKWGMVLQGALYVAPKFELFARWELGQFTVADPSAVPMQGGTGSLYAFENHLNIGTVGVNWYIDGQDAKFTFDVGYAFDTFEPSWFQEGSGWRVTGSRDELVARGQFQLGF
ncbi:MAG: porin [Phycisphaerales bacterium]